MYSDAGSDFRLDLQRKDGTKSLALTYSVMNLLERPLFLFNVLHEEMNEAGTFPLGPQAYVEIDGEAVIVSRKLFPVPELMFVEAPNLPFVTRVAPRETFRETVTLAVPLNPADPYSNRNERRRVEVMDRPLLFELGYFVGAAGTENLARPFPTDQGPKMGFDAFSPTRQKLYRTRPLGMVRTAVPVVD